MSFICTDCSEPHPCLNWGQKGLGPETHSVQDIDIFWFVISGGSRVHRRRAPLPPPPPRVQILSFWHTNFFKRSRLGSWHPLRGWRPPTGNPGSVTGHSYDMSPITMKKHQRRFLLFQFSKKDIVFHLWVFESWTTPLNEEVNSFQV